MMRVESESWRLWLLRLSAGWAALGVIFALYIQFSHRFGADCYIYGTGGICQMPVQFSIGAWASVALLTLGALHALGQKKSGLLIAGWCLPILLEVGGSLLLFVPAYWRYIGFDYDIPPEQMLLLCLRTPEFLGVCFGLALCLLARFPIAHAHRSRAERLGHG